LEGEETPDHVCHLCKTPFDNERTRARIVSLINETALQLKQSRLLQSKREERRNSAQAKLARLEEEWRRASSELGALQRLPSTESRERLRQLNQRSGYLARQIEDIEDKARLIQLIDQLSRSQSELNVRMNELRLRNERLRATQSERLARAYTAIADEVRTLLRNDLRRQDSFEDPKSIDFSFQENKISVDGHSYFSASSRVVLKTSFFVGFLAAATKNPLFRHPRFVMLDTIEDKGMEPERSHNSQHQVLRVSREAKVEHQIIFATAMIAPDLDSDQYTIGKSSTRDSPTLDIAS
jgi:hypothetical protein